MLELKSIQPAWVGLVEILATGSDFYISTIFPRLLGVTAWVSHMDFVPIKAI